jgi:hypothetical protein
MSHQSIAEQKFQDWLARDRSEGRPDTPERRLSLRQLADDFADEMQQDAERDAQGRDEEWRERHPERDEEPDDYPGDEAFA